MSKKNLARTVIEGGRSGEYKYVRDVTRSIDRRKARDYCHRSKLDLNFAEEHCHPIEDPFVDYIDNKFKDKLGPLHNWLASKAGQKWDNIYSEICKTFDKRTTAGRHILYDHLLGSVAKNADERPFADFYIDDYGILIARVKHPFGYRYPNRKSKKISILNWTKNRYIIDYGNVQFWTDVVSDEMYLRDNSWCTRCGAIPTCMLCRKYYKKIFGKCEHSPAIVRAYIDGKYYTICSHLKCGAKQAEKLSAEEVKFWTKVLTTEERAFLRYNQIGS